MDDESRCGAIADAVVHPLLEGCLLPPNDVVEADDVVDFHGADVTRLRIKRELFFSCCLRIGAKLLTTTATTQPLLKSFELIQHAYPPHNKNLDGLKPSIARKPRNLRTSVSIITFRAYSRLIPFARASVNSTA